MHLTPTSPRSPSTVVCSTPPLVAVGIYAMKKCSFSLWALAALVSGAFLGQTLAGHPATPHCTGNYDTTPSATERLRVPCCYGYVTEIATTEHHCSNCGAYCGQEVVRTRGCPYHPPTHTVRNPVSHTVMRHPVARMTCLPASNPSCGNSDSPHGSVAASQPLSQHLSRCRSISGAVAASMACCCSISCCHSIRGTMTATIFFFLPYIRKYIPEWV
ncbi:hypothetical protein PCANC_13516 [Puccinia coronata f. sp. avenae]|uniref:C2H2-type domain-containing protein n=1 Tax=Puccinia coronata f. sp. avenae TaxID=200324 RepID=A0A2N5USZ8_9BASI|nr:hypothetical protein PCANC_13516 [Puccinia coronata f. sp. avenae]